MASSRKLTPKVRDEIVESVRAGCFARTAALAAGIAEKTFYAWRNRGEAAPCDEGGEPLDPNERPYVAFARMVRQAEAEAEARAVKIIANSAMDGTWQSAAWYLERKHPERWAQRTMAKVEANVTAGVTLEDLAKLRSNIDANVGDECETRDIAQATTEPDS